MDSVGFLIINAPAALACTAWLVYVKNPADVTKPRRVLGVFDLSLLTASILWWYIYSFRLPDVILESEWRRFVTFGWIGVGLALAALMLSFSTRGIAKGALLVVVILSAIVANLFWVVTGFFARYPLPD